MPVVEYLPADPIAVSVTARTSALDTLVYGVDVQRGDVRGDSPSYALVRFDGEKLEREIVSHRKLLRSIDDEEPDLLATDNAYELAEDKDALVHLLRSLPANTTLVQVTGDERPEPLSRVAKRHGIPYGKDPMQEAEAAARLAAHSVGYEVSAFTNTTKVKVSRGRSTGKGGWSEDRFTRRIHGSVKTRARDVESALDDAGLDFERDVTEKYGGFSNAVFTVEATPDELPVSRERSGDVRIEIERQRRDGLEFEPLAKRRDRVLVGIDPGTTTAVALLDLDGEVLDVLSTRTADTADVIEWIVDRGRPVLVAADVEPMPETVEKIRRSFDAAGWHPERDLPIDEKQHRTRDEGYDNDHERDALAAALFAHDDHADQIERVRRKVPHDVDVDAGEVVARTLSEEKSVETVLADLRPDEDSTDESTETAPPEPTPEQVRISELTERVEQLEAYVGQLAQTVEEKEAKIDEYEEQLSAARREERRDAKERREVTRLKRENDRLRRTIDELEDANDELAEKLDRLKELWKLDHSNFADIAEEKEGLVPVKPIEQFTRGAIDAADDDVGLARDDVLLLRDASGAGRSTAERLATVDPRLVLKRGGLSREADEVLFEHDVPVAPASEVTTQTIDELVVAREDDVESAIAAWEDRAAERSRAHTQEMVDELISEHRADRRDVSPSELLDS